MNGNGEAPVDKLLLQTAGAVVTSWFLQSWFMQVKQAEHTAASS